MNRESGKNKELAIVQKVAEQVKKKGGTVYFVGGYIRDKQMGIASKDIDIEIHGISESALVEVLSSIGYVDKVGESFGVYLIKGVDVDFALPRTERKTGERHTDFDVEVDPFIGTQEASRRRDFTMNALMEDVLTGELIDHFGGLADIQKGLIRLVDADTFQEDALRVLRAIQFSARFGFAITQETFDIASRMPLHHLAKERVYQEIEKGMEKGDVSYFIETLKRFETVRAILPSLQGVQQTGLSDGFPLSYNVALLGKCMDDGSFQQLLKDFIQRKQDRKQATAYRRFLEAVTDAQASFEEVTSVLVEHEQVRELFPIETNELVIRHCAPDVQSLYALGLEKFSKCALNIDGRWLMERGILPSASFAEQLRKAKHLALMGVAEDDIVPELVKNATLIH